MSPLIFMYALVVRRVYWKICYKQINTIRSKCILMRAGALVQWLKLPAWKVGDRGFQPHSGLRVFSPLTRKETTMWETSVTER